MSYQYGTATEIVARGDIKHMSYAWGDLLNRGWTRESIREYLGPPDYEVYRQRGGSSCPYWKRARVKEIEARLDHDSKQSSPRFNKGRGTHGTEPMAQSSTNKNTETPRVDKKPTFEGYPYENYTVGISVAAREVIERVHRLANPQYPDLTAKEVVIDAATNEYHSDGMPPWPISRADFMCGDVLLVLLFDLTDQRLACRLASEEEDGKTPRVIIDESGDPFSNDLSQSSEARGNTIH